MATDTASGIPLLRRPPPWHDQRIRSAIWQILLVGVVVALVAFLVHNTFINLRRQNIASGFGFLDREAAFGIGESLIAYSPADTYARAFLVGLLNTLYVSALGIVLATVLGTLMGIARLSSNWLIRKLAQVYVETFRNIPLLLQLFFWWALLRETAPPPRQAWELLPGVLGNIHLSSGVNLSHWADHTILGVFHDAALASLLYSLAFVTVCWVPMYFLYRKRIFFKI